MAYETPVPSPQSGLQHRSAALRASHALLLEIARTQPVAENRAQVHLRVLEALRGTTTGSQVILVVPIWPADPGPLQRPVSPWEQGTLRPGLRLLALAETRETALERVLAAPALRSLWPGEAAEDVRALLAAERSRADARAAIQVVAARRSQGGPLLGEWMLHHVVGALSQGPLIDDVRALLVAPDASAAVREAAARALYEASLLAWEVAPAHAHALARALVEGTLAPAVPAPLRGRLVAGEVRALLADTEPPPRPDALLPDPAARARARTALAALGTPAAGPLAAWLA